MRRGEVRIVHGLGGDRQVLIVGNDALNETEPTILATPIDTTGAAPETLVTVRISQPVAGLVRLDKVAIVRRERFGDMVGRVAPETMDAINIALRAALDL